MQTYVQDRVAECAPAGHTTAKEPRHFHNVGVLLYIIPASLSYIISEILSYSIPENLFYSIPASLYSTVPVTAQHMCVLQTRC